MNLTQEQWFSLLFTLGFGLAYIVGKVLEDAFKDKKVDLSMYTFVTGFAAFFSIFRCSALFRADHSPPPHCHLRYACVSVGLLFLSIATTACALFCQV